MKKLSVLIPFVIALVSCSLSQETIDVSFFGTRGDQYHLVYDVAGTGLLIPEGSKTCTLTEASKEVNPGVAISRGDFYVTTDSKDKMATFAKTVYNTVELPKGSITLNSFSHLGENQILLGSDFDGNVWLNKGEEKPLLIAEYEYRDVKYPDGGTQKIMMRKGLVTGDKWVGDVGGMIYQENEGGELKQIGFVEWRLIKMENGSPMTIMMAKGMGDGAKWRGYFNGVVYLDK